VGFGLSRARQRTARSACAAASLVRLNSETDGSFVRVSRRDNKTNIADAQRLTTREREREPGLTLRLKPAALRVPLVKLEANRWTLLLCFHAFHVPNSLCSPHFRYVAFQWVVGLEPDQTQVTQPRCRAFEAYEEDSIDH
jgi:hypothetical protein